MRPYRLSGSDDTAWLAVLTPVAGFEIGGGLILNVG
jgi:hypothetical protein